MSVVKSTQGSHSLKDERLRSIRAINTSASLSAIWRSTTESSTRKVNLSTPGVYGDTLELWKFEGCPNACGSVKSS